jgi:cell division protein FtsB
VAPAERQPRAEQALGQIIITMMTDTDGIPIKCKGHNSMIDNSLAKEIDRDIDQLKEDLKSHHWLLAVAIAMVFFAATTIWRLADHNASLTTAAAIIEKLNTDNIQLKYEVEALRKEIAALHQNAVTAPLEKAVGRIPSTQRRLPRFH